MDLPLACGKLAHPFCLLRSLPYSWIVQDPLSVMMYTCVPCRAFQLPVAHEVEPKACTRLCDLGACRLATTPSLAYSYRRVRKFPDTENVERLDQRLNVPVYGQCSERRSSHKVQHSTSWLAVRDHTNCGSLAHK